MPMPPIEFRVAMFRDERDQARSQYVLLFLMEALTRTNQSLLRHAEGLKKLGLGETLPLLYRSGLHYEREPPGQEHWPDIVNLLGETDGPGKYPGPWGDCEDLACYRVGELREAPAHRDPETGQIFRGGVKAMPFAKWRRGSEGQFNYHALVLRPDGKIEDPSLVLGMRREAEFAADRTAEKLRAGLVKPVIQFAEPPDVMVVDPDSPSGYLNRTDPRGLVGAPGGKVSGVLPLADAVRALSAGRIDSYGTLDAEGTVAGATDDDLGRLAAGVAAPGVRAEVERIFSSLRSRR
jgi:hypothetical protein